MPITQNTYPTATIENMENIKYINKRTKDIAVKHSDMYYVIGTDKIPKRLIEDSGEWEKDIPKDYKILSFRVPTSGSILTLRNDGRYYFGGDCKVSYSLKDQLNGKDEIQSVKRLSDNSIWTVGDIFNADAGCELTIKCFKIIENKYVNVWSKEYGYWKLNDIEKVKPKEPLFTTLKGEPVYEGDTYWYVSKTFSKHITNGFLNNATLRFLTEKDADEYILANKPRELIYTTFDNVKIYKGDNLPLYVVDDSFVWWDSNAISCEFLESRKYFANKEKRNEYVLNNAPVAVRYKELMDYLPKPCVSEYEAIENMCWYINNFFKSKIHI